MKIIGILAVGPNELIGDGDRLPWHHVGDLRRFRQLTMKNYVLMGGRTFAGILKNYSRPNEVVMSGRTLVIYGRADELRQQVKESGVRPDNIEAYSSHNTDLTRLIEHYAQRADQFNRTLYVAGGLTVYNRTKAHWTGAEVTIMSGQISAERPVNLTEPLESWLPDSLRLVSEPPQVDTSNPSITATYYTYTTQRP